MEDIDAYGNCINKVAFANHLEQMHLMKINLKRGSNR